MFYTVLSLPDKSIKLAEMPSESEQISVECDQILDKYGYNKTMAERRLETNTKVSQSMTMMTHQILGHAQVDKVLVGSRREGISLLGESDTDVMFILNDVLARERSKSTKFNQKQKGKMSEPNNTMNNTQVGSQTVYVMDRAETHAGYTLLHATSNNADEYTHSSMVKTQNGTFLSSRSFLTENKYKFRLYQGWMKNAVQYAERNGPSLPETMPATDTYLKTINFLTRQCYVSNEKDCVIALPCHCPSLLHKWQQRKRSCNWPTQEVIQQVAELPVHVVPVGLQGTRNEDLQWRISFTFAEIHLVQSLSDAQIKVLVLLRMIAKEKLKPISNKVSSYVIKNVMFWLCESKALQDFTSKTLLERVQDCLLHLRECISRKQLQCYMLPQRNLLCKLNKTEVKQLVSALDQVIHNDNAVFSHVLTESVSKKQTEKLAALDRIECAIYNEMTPHELFEILYKCGQCQSSFGQHVCGANSLFQPYSQRGRKRFLRFVQTNNHKEKQMEVQRPPDLTSYNEIQNIQVEDSHGQFPSVINTVTEALPLLFTTIFLPPIGIQQYVLKLLIDTLLLEMCQFLYLKLLNVLRTTRMFFAITSPEIMIGSPKYFRIDDRKKTHYILFILFLFLSQESFLSISHLMLILGLFCLLNEILSSKRLACKRFQMDKLGQWELRSSYLEIN